MPFPHIFPFKFDEFRERWAKFTNIDDGLIFRIKADSLSIKDTLDTLTFTRVGS